MSQNKRLKNGGRINRNKALNFSFNGKPYIGFEGDTIASALLANDVMIIGLSFKYRRVRGIIGSGAEECNAIFDVMDKKGKTTPNCRATQTQLTDDMTVTSLSIESGKKLVSAKFLRLFHRFMPVGFYYKTFIKPKFLWPMYERLIRYSTGLGLVPKEKDTDRYDKLNQHCDALIIGAGPAGLAAALPLSAQHKKVIIIDEQNEFGGSLLSVERRINDMPSKQWLHITLQTLASRKNVIMLPRSTAFGYYDHNLVGVIEKRTDHLSDPNNKESRQRFHRVRAKQVIMATGVIERPMVFSNNDKPGIMLASSVSTYIKKYAVLPGNNVIIFTANDNAYQTALDVIDAGGEVAAVIDIRRDVEGDLVKRVKEKKVRVLEGYAVIEALGKKSVTSINVAPIDDKFDSILAGTQNISCDMIAMSAGFSPVVHLSSHCGSKPIWDDTIIGFVPSKQQSNFVSVGACNGAVDLLTCLQQGADVGETKFEDLNYQTDEIIHSKPEAFFLSPHYKSISRAPKQFVDFQLDVTSSDLMLAAREGYDSIELVKRYTALGFGTDQGKLGNINGIGILAKILGKNIQDVGTTVFRPSYTPSTFGAIAGRNIGNQLLAPERRTPLHHWHEKHGAKWENVGQWKRAWYYPQKNESMLDSINRECLAVRNSVGMLDASTLGKIDIQGADAAEFINRIYTNAYLKLAIGRCRYGLMLKEDGMVFDDGVTARLAENHYLMFTTTGGAANVLSWLECWHQTEWPELKVYFNSVTDHWATITVSGPESRKVLQAICNDIDFSKESFKFLDAKEGTVEGIKARIFRISFTGELTYEINVPANYAHFIWKSVYKVGKPFNITPYGTETMHVLRAEKGFIIVGQDTDGSVTPGDLNMDWVVGKKKKFNFIGRRGLARPDCLRDGRKQLVGLKTSDPLDVIPEGAQIVNSKKDTKMQGHVTSSYYSAALKSSIAMALIKSGLERMGDTVFCPLANGKVIEAKIVSSVFYDPKGEKQNVD